MTTESTQAPASSGTDVLLRSGLAASVVVAVLVAVAALVGGSTAALGALVGGGVAVAVFLGGSLVVNAVAWLMPGLSLLVALMTYLLQVLALGLLFAALRGSDLLGPTISAGWLAAAVITVTATWLVVQVVLATRARIPVYDLSVRREPGRAPQAGAR